MRSMTATINLLLSLALTLVSARAVPPVLILAGAGNSVDAAILEFDPVAGSLAVKGYTSGGDNDFKGWFSRHPINPNIIISCNDQSTPFSIGNISSFLLDPASGNLTLLDKKNSGGIETPDGVSAAHTAFFPSGDVVGVANYYGQGASTFKFNAADGTIGEAINTDGILTWANYTIRNGQLPDDQNTSHPHEIVTHPFLPVLYIPDLGEDVLRSFTIGEGGKLTVQATYPQKLGSGPRHAAISSNGKFLYLLHELGVTLSVYSVDLSAHSTGRLTLLQEGVTIYPANATFSLTISAAEVRISNDGRFLYATNRNLTTTPFVEGDVVDTVSVYGINDDGRIKRIQSAAIPSSRGLRGFELSPATTTPNVGGQDYVVVGGQITNNTSVLKRSRIDGTLQFVASVPLRISPITFIWV
ncbi:Lactonase, 7-bladed beta-propeller-domain-containing protein [Mycena pura]|uniref:Lactonase, 7-bladed beta-propeller-domain-containing protein n=1 Tax=Mycena pura TaxID=153505 RepID=A0AAD6V3L3_9AGAR|nr:Lactonase, 7-bladed beta-propeller-domain-containing protein [Mycena pura]